MKQTEIYNNLDKFTKQELIWIIIENQCFVSDKWIKNLQKKELNVPFERFWEAYGYKKWSKSWAETARKRLTNKEREDAMLAIPIYVRDRNEWYICMATTWIHQKRWEGILEEEKQKQLSKQKERENKISRFSQGPLEWKLQPIA